MKAITTCPVCRNSETQSEGVASDEEGQAEEVYERGSCSCGAEWISRATVRWYETEITNPLRGQ